MPTTAREEGRNLVIDFGESGTFTVPPMSGKQGRIALDLLLGITLGTTRHQHGQEREESDTEELTGLAVGFSGLRGRIRKARFERLRAQQQQEVAQAAILWNVHGGSIDAVHDLLDEAGGYPKALGRVMRSCGQGQAYEALMTLLNGADQALSKATASSASTTTPTGTANTSD